MRYKPLCFAISLVIALSMCACTPPAGAPQDTETMTGAPAGGTTEAATEGTTETLPDLSGALRNSGEEWIVHGLKAYEEGREPQDLAEFFATPSNLTYLTLFDHFFTYDREQAIAVAEALFRFIADEHGIEAIADLDKRVEFKNEYLASLGLEIEYMQAPEVERLLASMEFSSSDKYPYVISFGKVTYYFKDFSAGSPSQYHGFLYFNTVGLQNMIAHLTEAGLDEGLDTEREFHFYMTFDGSGYSQTRYPSGNMYINDHSSALHEAMHAMGIRTDDHIWLSEGICNYFGKALGCNEQIAASHIQILSMTQKGYFDEAAAAGDISAIQYQRIYAGYVGKGGTLSTAAAFDHRLYADTVASVQLSTNAYVTLGDTYKAISKIECTAVGAELSYDQATSLVLYLADTYGIGRVMEAYRSQDVEGVFGKGYAALKADWLSYLHEAAIPDGGTP